MLKGLRLALLFCALLSSASQAGPGVSDSEIIIGQTMPYSGPASSLSKAAVAELAYLQMINDQGGINGRKIKLISLDDGYSPPKTVEQTRRLVESEDALLIFQSVGTPTNAAVQKYLNQKGVPQILIGSGGKKFNDPAAFPWTIGWAPTLELEGSIYGSYIAKEMPDAKIGVLWQYDDFGKELLEGFRRGLGDKAASMIVKDLSFEVSAPTVDSQIVAIESSGANVVFLAATGKATAQALRKAYELGWKPRSFVPYSSSTIPGVLRPIGLEKVQGLTSATYMKDPFDAQWKDDSGVKEWHAWMEKYLPKEDKGDYLFVYGYSTTQALVEILKACGSDLSRENVKKVASSLNLKLPMLLPGIVVSTTPSDLRPIRQMQLHDIRGEGWSPLGSIITGK